ncbi:hypothetical protein Ddye_024081 [Dipteronia dyeriana]|uniref:Serine hydroxymethyltransferase-like domain-containing protein n=1 Tax=Dipteronia dyeriana TaxID=168575 RepID=A0AAD9WTV1_9ROSI|nr:hypothetical protein Ddye_024081 [Dipteronia dyeriana]
MDPVNVWANSSLVSVDPEIHDLIEKEKRCQCSGIELIDFENFTSFTVTELALRGANSGAPPWPKKKGDLRKVRTDSTPSSSSSTMPSQTNTLRALLAFHMDPTKWGVNVQLYSGSPKNFTTYTTTLKPYDRIMGLDLPLSTTAHMVTIPLVARRYRSPSLGFWAWTKLDSTHNQTGL